MRNIGRLMIGFLLVSFLYSCNKKSHPGKNDESTNTANTTTSTPKAVKAVSATEYSTGKRKVTGTSTPHVIIVEDKNARKTADGKLYYDLGGYRYWRNDKDGKYYLDGLFSDLSGKSKKTKSTTTKKN